MTHFKGSHAHKEERHGLNYFLASLALLSSMIGGGITGIPYAYYQSGFGLGLIINVVFGIQTALSCFMYFQVKDLCGGTESISEVGFKLLGRFSIYLMNGIILLLCIGLMLIYFILYGNIVSSLAIDFGVHIDTFFAKPAFWIIIMAIINSPPIFFRAIKELKAVSILLGVSIVTFVTVLVIYCIQTYAEGKDKITNGDDNYAQYWDFKIQRSVISSISLFILSFNFQITLFSTYTSLEVKSTAYAMKAAKLTIIFSQLIYLPVAFTCIYLFGSHI